MKIAHIRSSSSISGFQTAGSTVSKLRATLTPAQFQKYLQYLKDRQIELHGYEKLNSRMGVCGKR